MFRGLKINRVCIHFDYALSGLLIILVFEIDGLHPSLLYYAPFGALLWQTFTQKLQLYNSSFGVEKLIECVSILITPFQGF
jgi:hypothetical protein